MDENTIEIRAEVGLRDLTDYATVPIAFTVRSRLDLAVLPVLREIAVAPWVKDYDALESPPQWPLQFDVRRWLFLSAWQKGVRVGGAVVAFDTQGVDMLEGRSDLGVLWDIRVAPAARGQGVGRALFEAAREACHRRGVVELKVETQDINVPACRFYSRLGFRMAEVVPNAYPDVPGEAMLIWRLPLSSFGGSTRE